MKSLNIFLTLCIVFCLTESARNTGCRITLPNDIPENEPVYLVPNPSGNLSLLTPIGQDIILGVNQQLHLFCPGSKSQLTNIGSTAKLNSSNVLCNSKFKFTINGNEIEFNRLNCTKQTAGDLRTTRQRCAGTKGVVHEIGFKLSPRQFLKQFEVCYNNQTASAIYSKHYINGKAIKYHIRESERRDFKTAGIPNSADPARSFKRNSQNAYFKTLFGQSQKYFNDSSFLSRGHLTPDADFIFTTSQFATYFYANVVPQFQSVNGGNWQRVESLARNLSSVYNRNLLVYTGGYGQLELENANGILIPVWLESDNKIQVPKWTWKVVINEDINAGIAFVTLNNPFVGRNVKIEKICTDICATAGIRTTGFDKIRNGFTYCCDVNELKTVVGVLPDSLRVNSLLSANI